MGVLPQNASAIARRRSQKHRCERKGMDVMKPWFAAAIPKLDDGQLEMSRLMEEGL